VSEEARQHWDKRYADDGPAPVGSAPPLPIFALFEGLFPSLGTALEVACGSGRGAVWLAGRGMDVLGIDVSPVAIQLARESARLSGVGERCCFHVHDLDHGLPDGEQMDLVVCYLFREAGIDQAMIDRLKPGGMLAVACLSEVGHGPGRFRAKAGELTEAFAGLDVQEAGEADGSAWLIGRKALG
jgi:SAM-dependent methyltransferase